MVHDHEEARIQATFKRILEEEKHNLHLYHQIGELIREGKIEGALNLLEETTKESSDELRHMLLLNKEVEHEFELQHRKIEMLKEIGEHAKHELAKEKHKHHSAA